jgi:hypothetical protein
MPAGVRSKVDRAQTVANVPKEYDERPLGPQERPAGGERWLAKCGAARRCLTRPRPFCRVT